MIDFIRPPIGPRVDLLRIQSVHRIVPTKEEGYQTIIAMQPRQNYDLAYDRPQKDEVRISSEALDLLEKDLPKEQNK